MTPTRKYTAENDRSGRGLRTPTPPFRGQIPGALPGNNQRSAEKSGGEVIFQNVTLTTNICPECKRVYVSGGVTRAAIASSSSKGNNIDTYA